MATASETAAGFGYTLSFFNSNPELKALLSRATSQSYSTQRFVAELQNTKWFRTTSESYRKYQALRSGDPATWTKQLDTLMVHVQTVGGEMGAVLDAHRARAVAHQAMQLGWSDEQLRQVLAGMMKFSNGSFEGKAAGIQAKYEQMAADYGVGISSSTLQSWVRNTAMGAQDEMGVKAALQKIAASKYVALKDRILAGETVREIADPYIQSYAKTLEVNPDSVGINDNLIQRALQSKGQDGKPATQTLYDFENVLRNDPRWAKTNNARDAMSSTANKILQAFGLSGG